MPTYNLSTTFSKEDLARLNATGSNLIVGKPNAGGQPNVAWLVFRPLEGNLMTWEENYGIYASNAELINGAQLTQMSRTDYPALDGKKYSLNGSGFFGPPSPGGPFGSYSAVNDYDNLPKGYLVMGLFQAAEVNGAAITGNAVSAAGIPYKSTAVMTPFTTVYLWTQSQVMSNTVVTNVTSPMTEVRFGGDITKIALVYDAKTGKFLPTSANALGDGNTLRHHVPLSF